MGDVVENVSKEVLLAFSGVAALLLVSNVILFFRHRANPQRDDTELVLRVRTWWIIVISFAFSD